ncbi:MAG: hypothetical protein KAX25_03910, partial [Dehalococcoidia bacterium]|nr:hypothetical protein [Dehalococcoidia bacterium]
MKKIISILVALGLVLSLVVMATPTAASSGLSFVEVSLGSGGTGTAEWSDAYQKSGSYSVKLSAPYDGSYGRVVMPLGMAFADLDDFSVWVEGGTTAQALPLLVIKAVVDGTAILPASNKGTGTGVDLDDKTIVLASQPGQSEGLSPTLMSDGIAGWELYGTHSAATIDVGTGAYWSIFVYSADGTTFVGVYDYYTWAQIHTVLDGKATVTDVRVDLSWPQDGSGGVTSTVYVDDITINPVYDLEPAVGPNCACANAEYTIRFTTTASLTEGFNSITIAFPDGTTVPGTFADGDITINGMDVFGSEVTVSGTTVTFLVPEDVDAGVVTQVTFTDDAGIKNPCTAGTYNLYVNTSRAPDATPVKSPDYDISPAISEYEFVVNFGNTYPGIAEDFVPPFKACGQDGWGVANGTRWDTALNLTLQTKGIP